MSRWFLGAAALVAAILGISGSASAATTIVHSLAACGANQIAAGPSTGATTAIACRPLVAADLPAPYVTFAGGTTTNTANAYTLASTTPGGFTFTDGYKVRVLFDAANTGASTLVIGALASEPIKANTSGGFTPLVGGEIQANLEYDVTANSGCICYVISSLPLGTTLHFSANTTITAAQMAAWTVFVPTASGLTLTLPAANTISSNGGFIVQPSAFSVTLAPNAADGINALAVNTPVTLEPDTNVIVSTTGATGAGAFSAAPVSPSAAGANTGTSGHVLGFLDGNNVYSAGQAITPVALTFGATVTPNAALSNAFTLLLGTLATPAEPTPTTTTQTGATIGATVAVFFKTTCLNAAGETAASLEGSVTTGAATDNTVTQPTPTCGAAYTGWNVYASTATGTETLQNVSPLATTTVSFTLTAPPTATGAAAPTINKSGNFTLANPTGPLNAGQTINTWITQAATGGGVLTLGTDYQAPGGSASLALSTAANAKDLLSCASDTAATLTCNLVKAIAH